ncbi:hypothetical protein EVAR_80827_1 [Eumeta japonica]|uniref:Uncharacterized protein n=1 Tax=Eumeta variegata TaxID=151549 RepID=A0A4C1WFI8_EUMVA|nr:hypothetical protein EVAR_80827_1 [Eumeta japonica]
MSTDRRKAVVVLLLIKRSIGVPRGEKLPPPPGNCMFYNILRPVYMNLLGQKRGTPMKRRSNEKVSPLKGRPRDKNLMSRSGRAPIDPRPPPPPAAPRILANDHSNQNAVKL